MGATFNECWFTVAGLYFNAMMRAYTGVLIQTHNNFNILSRLRLHISPKIQTNFFKNQLSNRGQIELFTIRDHIQALVQ